MAGTPILIRSRPGIKRDGTQFEGDSYIDGQWCRFQRGLPRKIAGYRSVTSTIPERIYGMHVYSETGTQYAHLGGASTLTQILMDSFGNLTGFNARIPAGFSNNPDNVWQFDILFDDTGGGVNQLVAHAGQNLDTIDSAVETPIYFGEITDTAVLTATGLDDVSGGAVVLAPFLLGYGNAGRVVSSQANDPSTQGGFANVTGMKIVKGLPLRGNGSGPSGLFWSLDSLIRATFDSSIDSTTAVPFRFDTVSQQQSIMSSRSIIEYDGIFYWWAVDRPLMFNGVVQTLANNHNVNWLLDNINPQQRQKMFAVKIPRWGEIWWCFPFGNATECTHAVIYNVNEKTWYDTVLPTSSQAGLGRTDGFYAQVYSKPFMTDQFLTSTPGYTLWQHETGTDSISGVNIQPIQSYFKTAEISMLTQEQAKDKALRVGSVEPDFVQTGSLTLTVEGRQNARASDVLSAQFAITPTAATPEQQTVPLKEVRRLMSFKFESNVAGGDYQMGDTLAFVQEDEGRARS
jgi:hypothetical protein